ncbi:UNVERIFIED_ORG: putative ATP-dependent endonuclease of OLD family [Pseudomonas lini]
MHIIESVHIRGFWGSHQVDIRTAEDYNFIIGPNGSGKSTALKLIAGVLLADKEYLSTLEFQSIKINLKEPGSRKKPSIEVIKNLEAPFFHCDYKISEAATEKPFTYILSETEGYEAIFRKSYFLRANLAGKDVAAKTLASHGGNGFVDLAVCRESNENR